jgi:hypothetical protein
MSNNSANALDGVTRLFVVAAVLTLMIGAVMYLDSYERDAPAAKTDAPVARPIN